MGHDNCWLKLTCRVLKVERGLFLAAPDIAGMIRQSLGMSQKGGSSECIFSFFFFI